MIILGILCLVVGWLLSIPVLWTIGAVLVVIGLVLFLAGTVAGRPVGGRSHYW